MLPPPGAGHPLCSLSGGRPGFVLSSHATLRPPWAHFSLRRVSAGPSCVDEGVQGGGWRGAALRTLPRQPRWAPRAPPRDSSARRPDPGPSGPRPLGPLLDPHAGGRALLCWAKPPARTFPSVARERSAPLGRLLTEFLVGQRRAGPASLGVPSPALLAPSRNSGVARVVVGGGGWPGPPGPAAPSSGWARGWPRETSCWRRASLGSQVGPRGPSVPGPRKRDGSHPQDQAHREAGAKGVWGVTDSRETQADT